MELELNRTYYPGGTNGQLFLNGTKLCATIELPWKDNAPMLSCIPEGWYILKKRYSLKFGWHLLVTNVPNRDLVLIHPANNALLELKGCIAPVSVLTGPGTGLQSRAAFSGLNAIAFAALQRKETVFLTIKSA